MKLFDFLNWLVENIWFNVFAILFFVYQIVLDVKDGDLVFAAIDLCFLLYYSKSVYQMAKED